MQPDDEGFLYPQIDLQKCTNCGLCEKVCPMRNHNAPTAPTDVWAAIHPKESIRIQSSSGGVFTFIAEKVLNKGGVVFGALFDENYRVVHGYTETKEGLQAMRGSKYVQSKIGETYKQAETFLKQGRLVLFTGVSCQILGLHLFLHKKYNNLITIDLICAGVPSPKLWKEYIEKEIIPSVHRINAGKNSVLLSPIGDISFRNKTQHGWKKFSFVVRSKKSAPNADKNTVLLSDIHYKNIYFRCMLQRATQRYSCYNCPAKEGRSQSDISLGDFWGFQEDLHMKDDDKGISLVLINTNKGQELVEGLQHTTRTYKEIIKKNPISIHSNKPSIYRKTFYSTVKKYGIRKAANILQRKLTVRRGLNKIFRILHLTYQLKY